MPEPLLRPEEWAYLAAQQLRCPRPDCQHLALFHPDNVIEGEYVDSACIIPGCPCDTETSPRRWEN